MSTSGSRVSRWLSAYLGKVLIVVVVPAMYVVYQGFDFVPGQQPDSDKCVGDIGEELSRHGHSEELLWRGCLIASDTVRHLPRFIPGRDITKSSPDTTDVPSCVSCHDGEAAPTFARMWTRFPRYNERTGRVEDLAQAIQDEIELRYGGVRPNRSDNAITALYFYAAAKAAQSGLRFQIEDAADEPLPAVQLSSQAPTQDCRAKFEQMGWPKGPNAEGVIRGCNLITETQQNVRGLLARIWRTDLDCQSCHLEAGDKSHAGSMADAAVVLPVMHTASNQPIRFDRRVLLCFTHSLNWYDLGSDARDITYINMYANWLAQKKDLPIGRLPEGRGIPVLHEAAGRGASFLAGEKVYKDYCKACHGASGLGGAGPIFRGREPPPIAGPHAFSAAASLADRNRIAGFVYANMPYGATMEHPVLTLQQALDVSAYLTSLGRPADFTRVNQLRVFFDHLWLKVVASLGNFISGFTNDKRAGEPGA